MIRSSTSRLSLLWILSLGLFVGSASANVIATPSFYDFGSVTRGGARMISITFQNLSPQPIPFFNVNCSGDYSSFQCFSMCSNLPAYGSCSVQVQFFARNGDGMRKMLWLNGNSSQGSASATVYGTDAKVRD